MKNNKFIKITLDSILILLTLGLFTMNFSNPTINKILGIAIFILTIIHIILHKDNLFMKKIPINDYNSYYNNVHNKITYVVNTCLAISLLILAATSIIKYKLVPSIILRKLYTNSLFNVTFFTAIHSAFITISLILIAIHIGMNMHKIFDLFTNNTGKINYKPTLCILIIVITFIPVINFIKTYKIVDSSNINSNSRNNSFYNGNYGSYGNSNSNPFSNGYGSYGNDDSDPFSNGYSSYGNDNSDSFSNNTYDNSQNSSSKH